MSCSVMNTSMKVRFVIPVNLPKCLDYESFAKLSYYIIINN